MASPQPPKIPDNFVKIVRITENTKRLRIIVVCLLIGLGIACITYAVVKIFARPAWATVAGWTILALLGPSGVIYRLIRARQKFVEKHHRRTVELEKALDEKRTSSEPESSNQSEAEQ